MNRIREWVSVKIVKAPGKMVLLGILVANLAIIGLSGFVISSLAPPSLENSGFWSSVYNTTTMVLGVGGVESVIEDIGEANVIYVLCCIAAIIVGMIVFTGAIIGYMTDFISGFIEDADSSSRKLHISDHVVILNWNTRAAEIVNELLYKGTREKVVVLAGDGRDDILGDIDERLADTLETGLKNKLTVIVRQGDPSSAKQLGDISIQRAKSVIILSDSGLLAPGDKGNCHTIKTLIQVAQLLSEGDAAGNQRVIVEAEDDWTLDLVDTVIQHKSRKGSCSIVPVAVNRILGQIFSAFSIMPELNIAYSDLFSNGGAAFYTQAAAQPLTEAQFVTGYLDSHHKAVPLTIMDGGDGKLYCYFMTDREQNIQSGGPAPQSRAFQVSLNPDFEIRDKHILILGHNSKSAAIMEGFEAFREEWKKDGAEVLDIVVIDDEANLAQQGYYKQYPFVKQAIAADIFDKDLICDAVGAFIGSGDGGDQCVMILSDDTVPDDEIDADALTYLILVQDILCRRSAGDPAFDLNSVDLIVELLEPKNYDIANNYSTNNIVISNRYISKIIMQIGEKDALFDFYKDILTFDEPGEEPEASKELYIKKVSEFFSAVPPSCTAAELIRAVYQASPDDNKSVVLGFVRPDDEMTLFTGDQAAIHVTLSGEDKLILFSDH